MLAEDVDVGSGLCTIWLTMRTLITGGKRNADSPWHKVAMQLLKLLTLLESHDHLLSGDWMRGDSAGSDLGHVLCSRGTGKML